MDAWHRLVALVVVLALSAGCAQTNAPSPATQAPATGAATQPTSAERVPTGSVVVALSDFGKETLDPAFDAGATRAYNGHINDDLVGVTTDGQISKETGVLEDWTVSPDAKTWTFAVRKGIKWHDGTDLTAADVKFTLDTYMLQQGTSCLSCNPVRVRLASAEATDQYTVKVTLKTADPFFVDVLGVLEGDAKVVPMNYYQQVGPKGYAAKPIGSGPWKFGSRTLGESLKLEANTDYWIKDQIPHFATLELRLVPDSSTRLAMLRTGQVDLAPIGISEVPVAESAGLKVQGPKAVGTVLIQFPQSYDPKMLTNKLDFRKALSFAIDRDALIKRFYPSTSAQPATGDSWPFNKYTKGHVPSLPGYEYDQAKARDFLRASGYSGQQLTFYTYTFASNPDQPEVNEVIAQMWRDIGIAVQVTPIDFGTYYPQTTGPSQNFAPTPVDAWASRSRPTVVGSMQQWMMSKAAGGGSPHYWNPEFADAEYKRLVAITDPEALEAEMKKLNTKLRDEYWAIPIAMRDFVFAVGPKISEWRPASGTQGALAFNTIAPKD